MEPRIWLDYTQAELDDQYNQRILVPDANDYMARWGVESERLRGVLECRLDVAYGPSEAERLDIFPAPGDGAPVVVHARSTIIATGGAPQLHEVNDSPPYISGDGYAIALRAGADLIDMEFIDYQLMVAAPERIRGYPPHSSGFINAGAYLYNKDMERFMRRYDPERCERSTRAMVNRAVGTEIYEGRGTENHGVYLDTCHVFDVVNDGATADIVRVLKNCGVDLSKEPFEVASGPHTYLGGIRIDEWGRTTVEGLYSGGEASGGVHGANRTGGAALADSYVFNLQIMDKIMEV